jgi:hypothetical protein
MGFTAVGVGATLLSTAVGVREAQLSRAAAKEAEVPPTAPPTMATSPGDATASQVQTANMMAQTAGASLLSQPSNPNRQIGSQVGSSGKSILGG